MPGNLFQERQQQRSPGRSSSLLDSMMAAAAAAANEGPFAGSLLSCPADEKTRGAAENLALQLVMLQGNGGGDGCGGGGGGSSSSSSDGLHHHHQHYRHPLHHLQQHHGHHRPDDDDDDGGGGGGSPYGQQVGGSGPPFPSDAHLVGNGGHFQMGGGCYMAAAGGGDCNGSSSAAGSGSEIMDELKPRKSQNMTECVPVPTSEHVAEIVGRQGCKIKALRAKTNTYIKTPVRGEEPVFVVTGRKEDVSLAKREILAAAEHFSQIRASRKNSMNNGNGVGGSNGGGGSHGGGGHGGSGGLLHGSQSFGQLGANQPGHVTERVRVPYRVVGLVVGPKGATIKRIQQQTQTYIMTPSREKDPVFEVTGLPANVEIARKEIESHIATRTAASGENSGSTSSPSSNFERGAFYGGGGGSGSTGSRSDGDVFLGGSGDDSVFAPPQQQHSRPHGLHHQHHGRQQQQQQHQHHHVGVRFGSSTPRDDDSSPLGFGKGITLQNLIDEQDGFSSDHQLNGRRIGGTGWPSSASHHHQSHHNNGSETLSHDSGVAGLSRSPPFETCSSSNRNSFRGSSNHPHQFLSHQSSWSGRDSAAAVSGQCAGNQQGIWGELSSVLGGLDLSTAGLGADDHHHHQNARHNNHHHHHQRSVFNNLMNNPRSSLDLGTLGATGRSCSSSSLIPRDQQQECHNKAAAESNGGDEFASTLANVSSAAAALIALTSSTPSKSIIAPITTALTKPGNDTAMAAKMVAAAVNAISSSSPPSSASTPPSTSSSASLPSSSGGGGSSFFAQSLQQGPSLHHQLHNHHASSNGSINGSSYLVN